MAQAGAQPPERWWQELGAASVVNLHCQKQLPGRSREREGDLARRAGGKDCTQSRGDWVQLTAGAGSWGRQLVTKRSAVSCRHEVFKVCLDAAEAALGRHRHGAGLDREQQLCVHHRRVRVGVAKQLGACRERCRRL